MEIKFSTEEVEHILVEHVKRMISSLLTAEKVITADYNSYSGYTVNIEDKPASEITTLEQITAQEKLGVPESIE